MYISSETQILFQKKKIFFNLVSQQMNSHNRLVEKQALAKQKPFDSFIYTVATQNFGNLTQTAAWQ